MVFLLTEFNRLKCKGGVNGLTWDIDTNKRIYDPKRIFINSYSSHYDRVIRTYP